jgi:alpha-N-arabinofuranosidase
VWIAIANVDPRRAARISIASSGQKNETLRGETLAAPKIDSVNTFAAPNTVAPKAVTSKRTGGAMTLEVAPASVTVVSLSP